MVEVLILAALAFAVVGVLLFAALCLAIHWEDRSPRLSIRPPSACTALTRRIAGLGVRQPAPPHHCHPDPRLALRGTARSLDGYPEGR